MTRELLVLVGYLDVMDFGVERVTELDGSFVVVFGQHGSEY